MHWSEKYIGRPYVLGVSDCARLVCDVRREVFGQPVPEEAEPERAASLTEYDCSGLISENCLHISISTLFWH